jgi:hypothetical protein
LRSVQFSLDSGQDEEDSNPTKTQQVKPESPAQEAMTIRELSPSSDKNESVVTDVASNVQKYESTSSLMLY